MGGRGRPHNDPIGFGVGPIRGIGVIAGEEGKTPIWDPIGFGVCPIRDIGGHCGGRPHSDPIGLLGSALLGALQGEGGDPNMGPYRDIWGRPY